jgi:UDP-N-acetylglucosamine 1-carboxyvinyltransferase
VLEALHAVGASLEIGPDFVKVSTHDRPRAANITALPYPGIPTDLQAQWMALLAIGRGRSVIRDAVFPHRWMHVAELSRLGAVLAHCGSAVTVDGVARLVGASVCATDLRAGAALVLAGLAARGHTMVAGLEHLDRGYVRLEEKLQSLGANIIRYSVNQGHTGLSSVRSVHSTE